MSIFSDYKVGALSDVEFHNACVEMNARERYYEDSMYYTDDEFDGCPYDYSEVDEGDECIGCKFYEVCKACFNGGTK